MNSSVRAEMEFASKWDMDGGPADGEKEQIRKLVLELGRLALNDAEAWLKMRRERPLQPV